MILEGHGIPGCGAPGRVCKQAVSPDRRAFHNEKVSQAGNRPGASPTGGLGRISVRPAAIFTPFSRGIVYPIARFTRLTTQVT